MRISVLAVIVLLVAFNALAGPISVAVSPPSVCFDAVSNGVSRWADDPIGTCTGAPSNECCSGATTDQQCQDLASNSATSPDFWTRVIYTCLCDNGNWACDTFVNSRGLRDMVAETIPNDAVVLADVSECLSARALLLP